MSNTTRYTPDAIRSLVLAGHGNAGKTTLAEALLFAAGAIPTMGSIERGNTVCDSDPQEKAAGNTLSSAVVHFAVNGIKINLLDTPGYPDFAGQALAALAGADTALIVINAQTGIELTTERMMQWATKRGLCRMIVVNKIDAENVDLPKIVAQIQERFGSNCMIFNLPAQGGKAVIDVLTNNSGDSDFGSIAEAHRALIDQIVEEDETLLDSYLENGEDPNPAQLHAPFEKALCGNHLIPIIFVSAKTGTGIQELLAIIKNMVPDVAESNPPLFYRGNPDGESEAFKAVPDPSQHVLAHVFKIIADPYMGKVSVFRVHQGTVKKESQLFVGESKRPFKVGHLFSLRGKEFIEVDETVPGDIAAIAKIDEIEFDSVLHDSHDEDKIFMKPFDFPKPMQGLAIGTTKKGDEQRLFEVLNKLAIEDPCFEVSRQSTTNETIIRGLGDMHLKSKLDKMAQQYKLEVATRPPQIPYRETVTKPAEGHCRHKKQSGGAGQFGEVYLRIEPQPRGSGITIIDEVKGGAIPGVFIPAVEKGIHQATSAGVVAGFPVHDLKVTIYDGKTHPVDGKEIAFVTAGRKAVTEAIRAAAPIILEPIVTIDIRIPESAIGDITGEISSRHGQITGTEPRGGGMVSVTGQAPLAAFEDFGSRLKSLTGGRGTYSLEFSHYDPVAREVQQQLVARFQPKEEEE